MEEEHRDFFLLVAAVIGLYYVVTRSNANVVLALYLAGIVSGCAATALVWTGRGMTPPHRMANMLFVPLGLLIPFAETGFSFARPDLFWLPPLALVLLNLHGRASSEEWRTGKRKTRERRLIEANIALRKDPKNLEACLRKARLYEEARSWPLALENFRKAKDMDADDYPEKRFSADEARILAEMMKESVLREIEKKKAASGFVLPHLGELVAPLLFLPLLAWDLRKYLVLSAVWMFALWCLKAEEEL